MNKDFLQNSPFIRDIIGNKGKHKVAVAITYYLFAIIQWKIANR